MRKQLVFMVAAFATFALFGFTPTAHTNVVTRDGVTYVQRGALGNGDYVVTNVDSSVVGAVQSVNGKTGAVVLTAGDLDAVSITNKDGAGTIGKVFAYGLGALVTKWGAEYAEKSQEAIEASYADTTLALANGAGAAPFTRYMKFNSGDNYVENGGQVYLTQYDVATATESVINTNAWLSDLQGVVKSGSNTTVKVFDDGMDAVLVNVKRTYTSGDTNHTYRSSLGYYVESGDAQLMMSYVDEDTDITSGSIVMEGVKNASPTICFGAATGLVWSVSKLTPDGSDVVTENALKKTVILTNGVAKTRDGSVLGATAVGAYPATRWTDGLLSRYYGDEDLSRKYTSGGHTYEAIHEATCFEAFRDFVSPYTALVGLAMFCDRVCYYTNSTEYTVNFQPKSGTLALVSDIPTEYVEEEEDPYFTEWKSGTSIVAGSGASNAGGYGVAIGKGATARTFTTTVGFGARGYNGVSDMYNTVVGCSAITYGSKAIALGYSAFANGTLSIAIGASTTNTGAVAIGNGTHTHGDYTFNTLGDGLEDFYIGDTNLNELVGLKADATVKAVVTKDYITNDLGVAEMDYPAMTNTVNEVKAQYYDEQLHVTWTVKMVNGDMKLYATTNINSSTLPKYTNWSTDNLPSGVTWAAQPSYDSSIDLWYWAYNGGTAQSEEGGANATFLTFGYDSGFTTTRSVIP